MIKTQRKTPKKACESYQNLSKEEKDKRQKKVRDRYKNLPEEKKQKICEYMKTFYLAHKKYLLDLFKDPRAISLASSINP